MLSEILALNLPAALSQQVTGKVALPFMPVTIRTDAGQDYCVQAIKPLRLFNDSENAVISLIFVMIFLSVHFHNLHILDLTLLSIDLCRLLRHK